MTVVIQTLAIGAGILLVLAAIGRKRGGVAGGTVPARHYGRADVAAAIDLAVRAHPILPRWFVWAMADKESGLDPSETNVETPARERSYGLFQINWNAHGEELTRRGVSVEQLFIPIVNAAYWSEIAEIWARAAMARGIQGDHVWYAVRLRAAGVEWENFGTALAREKMLAFRPFVTRWQTRMGR